MMGKNPTATLFTPKYITSLYLLQTARTKSCIPALLR